MRTEDLLLFQQELEAVRQALAVSSIDLVFGPADPTAGLRLAGPGNPLPPHVGPLKAGRLRSAFLRLLQVARSQL